MNTKEMIHKTLSVFFCSCAKMSSDFGQILHAKHVLRGTQLIHNFVWTSTRDVNNNDDSSIIFKYSRQQQRSVLSSAR